MVTPTRVRADSVLERTKLEPRPYQRRIMQKALDWFHGEYRDRSGDLKPAARSVMIESPTGSGKTPTALVILKALQEETNYKIAWFAMRRELLIQAARENREKEINADINFVSMFSSVLPEADIVVIDEAQHDSANTMAHVHNVIKPKMILGMTATPFRCDRVKLVFDAKISDCGIKALIQDGWLSPYHHFSIPKWTPESVTDTYLREPERFGKSIVFFHRTEHCLEAQTRLQKAGVKCDVVTGNSDREAQLSAFNAGETDVLLNCMVLTEGFDCPDLKTVFCRDSAKGPTMQMCGRVFRKHASLPFKQIVQSGRTHWPFLRTALPEMQFLWQENEWRSLKVNPLLERMSTNSISAIANAVVEVPKYIAERVKKKRNVWRG